MPYLSFCYYLIMQQIFSSAFPMLSAACIILRFSLRLLGMPHMQPHPAAPTAMPMAKPIPIPLIILVVLYNIFFTPKIYIICNKFHIYAVIKTIFNNYLTYPHFYY